MVVYHNGPKDAIVQSATEKVLQLRAQGVDAHVYFKATCPNCSERCMFSEPDITYDTMECCECGTVFPFTEGNYLISNTLFPRTINGDG
jgi:hypothetical protein